MSETIKSPLTTKKFSDVCPTCDERVAWNLHENVTCSGCGARFYTDYDHNGDTLFSWIHKSIK